jgi:hypothetical protein
MARFIYIFNNAYLVCLFMKNYPKTIDEILTSLDAKEIEVIEKLRAVIKSTLPSVEETVKRGSITYVLDGKNLVRIHNYKGHADLGFFNGDRLSSPLLKTRGKGRSWRHVEINSLDQANEQEIKRLLEKSAMLFQL